MTPLQRYQFDLQQRKIKSDERQWQAVQHTQRLYSELMLATRQKPGLLQRLLRRKKKPVRGLYLWGGTGRGKTYLVDSFYECLPDTKKYRVHFHRFMLDIHQRLKQLPRSPDPLDIIADQLAEDFRVLCLDEFHVHDIADAMLLAGLLKAMFDRGITLVATSNIAIENLYQNGLQRERFMYAIELLQQYTEEFDLGDGTDYRFHALEKSEHYFVINEQQSVQKADDFLTFRFSELAPCQPKSNRSIEINHRQIHYRMCADDVIWFDFSELCQTPRSAHDYIAIAERYHTVMISNIPQLGEQDDSAAKRFIHLIDALYDHNVKLLATAHAEITALYQGQRLQFAFERTISRLTEMGSEHYLKLAHNPAGSVRIQQHD